MKTLRKREGMQELRYKVLSAIMAASVVSIVGFSDVQGAELVANGDAITVSTGTLDRIVGGQELLNPVGGELHRTGTTQITMNGGDVLGRYHSLATGAIVGGHLMVGDASFDGHAQGAIQETNVTINGGRLEGPVYGGNVVQYIGAYEKAGSQIQSEVNKVSLQVNGGTFIARNDETVSIDEDNQLGYTYPTNSIFAGGAAVGVGTSSSVKSANVVVSNLNKDVKLDTDNINEYKNDVRIYGGGFAQAGGQATVDEVTIDAINSKNISIFMGGRAVPNRLTIKAAEGSSNLTYVDDFSDLTDEVARELGASTTVKKSTVHIRGGQINELKFSGESPSPGANVSVDHGILHYYDGMVGNIDIDMVKEAEVHLHHDLLLDTPKYKGERIDKNTQAIRVNPGLPGGVNVAVTGNGHAFTGDLVVADNGTVKIDKLSAFNGEIRGTGNVVITGDMDVSRTIFNNENITLGEGQYNRALHLNKDITLAGGTVAIHDFEKDVIGSGQIKLTNASENRDQKGTIITNTKALFGAGADDAMVVDNSGEKKLPEHLVNIVDNHILFRGGKLVVEADKYSVAYANAVANVINQADGGIEAGNDTTIEMSGALVGNINIDQFKDPTRLTQVKWQLGAGGLNRATVDVNGKDLVIASEQWQNNARQHVSENATVLDSADSLGAFNLGPNSTGIAIGDKSTTWGGNAKGQVVLVDNKEQDVTVTVGLNNDEATGAVLTLGNKNTDVPLQLQGALSVNKTGTVQIDADTAITSQVQVQGGLVKGDKHLSTNTIILQNGGQVHTGTLSADTMEVTGEAVVSGNINVNTLQVAKDSNGVVQVGTEDKSVNAVFQNVALQGGAMILDPAWNKASGSVAVNFVQNTGDNPTNYIDGKLLVGQNTYATIGNSNDAKAMFETAKQSAKQVGKSLDFGEQNVQAALYIKGNQSLGQNGAVYINGAQNDATLKEIATTQEVGTFEAHKNTITMVDGQASVERAALSGVKNINIEDGALLYVDNAQPNQTYHILTNDGTAAMNVSHNGWTSSDSLLTTNMKLVGLMGRMSDDKHSFDIITKYNSVKDVYDGRVITPDIFDVANQQQSTKVKSLVDTLTNTDVINSVDGQVDALNSVANMVALSGASYATVATSNMLHDSVVEHLHTDHVDKAEQDVWAKVIHGKDTVAGATLGNMKGNYDSQYNGIIVGGDFYQTKNATLGIAGTYVDGDVKGHTLTSSTKNEANYYGLSVYGSMTQGAYTLMSDISYLHGSHDVTHSVAGERLTATFDTDAWSAGVRGERKYNHGSVTLTPYAGVRYVHLETDGASNNVGLSYAQDSQNIFLLPVGVNYRGHVQRGNWTIMPQAELGYVWNTGDRTARQVVSLDGTANGFTYDVTDKGSWIGKLGVAIANDRVTYAVDYEHQKGDTIKSNRFNGYVNIKF